MKIICIGRNYAAHASELGNSIPSEPVIFLKPSTALVQGGKPFFYPDFSRDIHHELELVLRISRNGKAIEQRFAHRYYEQVTVGLDFTARDLQDQLKQAGLPWEKAKAFDGSAVIGDFVPVAAEADLQELPMELLVNGQLRQTGQASQMLFGIDRLIAETSRYFRLMKGDLLFTGTPPGVAAVQIGDELQGRLGGKTLLRCRVK